MRRGRHRGSHRRPGRMADGLGHRFHLIWLGQGLSYLGDYVAFITLPAFVVDVLSDRALDVGITYALEIVPTVIVGLIGGAFIDRWVLRRVLVTADLARASLFFLLATLAWRGEAELWQVFAISFGTGTFAAGFNAALVSILPGLVPPSKLSRANARLVATQQAAFVVGPALGGALVGFLSHGAALAFNGLTFLLSAVLILAMGPVARPRAERTTRLAGQIAAGWRFLLSDPRLRFAAIAAMSVNLVSGFFEAAYVPLAENVLGAANKQEVGLIYSALGVGALAGASGYSLVARRYQLGQRIVVGLVFFGAGLAASAYLGHQPWATVALAFGFVGLPIANISLPTMRQLYTPPQMLGRVQAASRAMAWSTLPIGALGGTALADVIGLRPVAIASGFIVLFTAAWARLSPVWRAREVAEWDEHGNPLDENGEVVGATATDTTVADDGPPPDERGLSAAGD